MIFNIKIHTHTYTDREGEKEGRERGQRERESLLALQMQVIKAHSLKWGMLLSTICLWDKREDWANLSPIPCQYETSYRSTKIPTMFLVPHSRDYQNPSLRVLLVPSRWHFSSDFGWPISLLFAFAFPILVIILANDDQI